MRVADLMRKSDRPAGRAQSPARPLGTAMVTLGSLCPTWSDAVTQMSVTNSVQAELQMLVQPRLDSFAERVGNIVAATQNEMRDLERAVEKSEQRVDSRLSGLEGRVAVLADSAARTEQRERDLNTRIAAIAESLLKDAEGAASQAGNGQRLDVLERSLQDFAERLEATQIDCRKGAQGSEMLEDRMDELEQHLQSLPQLADELRNLAESAATAAVGATFGGQRQDAAESLEQGVRLRALEEQMHVLSTTIGGSSSAQSYQAIATIERRLDTQRLELEAVAAQLAETGNELRTHLTEQVQQREQHREATRTSAEKQQATSARLDDLNLRMGALKVKTDGLEGRLHSGIEWAERGRELETARWPAELEAKLQKAISDRCDQLASDAGSRLEMLEERLEILDENCEDAAEEALERRLAVLSGDLPPRPDRGGSSCTSRDRGRVGREAARRPELCRTTRGNHGSALGGSKLGTPAQSQTWGVL